MVCSTSPVVLRMEHVMDRGQADVFIHPAVTGNELDVEQFIIIEAVGRQAAVFETDRDIAILKAVRDCGVCDVGQEGVTGLDGAHDRDTQPAIGGRISLDEDWADHWG